MRGMLDLVTGVDEQTDDRQMLQAHFPGKVQQPFLEVRVEAFDFDENIQVGVFVRLPLAREPKTRKSTSGTSAASRCFRSMAMLRSRSFTGPSVYNFPAPPASGCHIPGTLP